MYTMLKPPRLAAVSGTAFLLLGCLSAWAQVRVQPAGPAAITTMGVDLADFKATADVMVAEMLFHPELGGFVQRRGRKPLLGLGKIRNSTDVSIDLGQLVGRINEDLLNSGLVEILANDAAAVDEAGKRDWADDRKRSTVQESDYLLEGAIMLLSGRQWFTREKTYSFQLRLNDTRSRKAVWQKTVDVTKQGRRPPRRW